MRKFFTKGKILILYNKIVQFINTKKVEYFLFSLILILGFVVRLYKINNPVADWHSWRQADTASVTRIYVQNGINLLSRVITIFPVFRPEYLTQTAIEWLSFLFTMR